LNKPSSSSSSSSSYISSVYTVNILYIALHGGRGLVTPHSTRSR